MEYLGTVRWYDMLTQSGVIRLDSNPDICFKFYSCNFKEANSYYSHLVTNIGEIKAGDKLRFKLSSDEDVVIACGAESIERM